MPINIINKVLENVSEIDVLLLTGGEIFLCPEQLKCVVDNIKNNHIKINYISIITNGTVLNSNIIQILKELSLLSNMQIYISSDKFHISEIENKGLLETRNKNVSLLKELFNAKEWYYYKGEEYGIDRVGNAETLTQDDLDNINNWGNVKTNYYLKDDYSTKVKRLQHPSPYIVDNNIFRFFYIDAKGNIAPVYYSYQEQDKLAYGSINNDLSFELNLKLIKRN